jgi:hypothetical protein
MQIKFNTPIEVSAKQYGRIMTELKGVCAGRVVDGKYFIKVWLMSWSKNVQCILEADV